MLKGVRPLLRGRGVSPPTSTTMTGSESTEAALRLSRVKTLTRLLDSSIRIPGTRRTFGLDPLIGLVPWLGDAIGACLSAWLVWQSARLGASRSTLVRMLWNVAVETLLGVVPLLGDLFDATWKANSRNLALLERHLAHPEATRAASRRFWALLAGGVISAVAGMVFVSGWLLVGLLRVVGLL